MGTNIKQKLLSIQAELKAPKNQRNTFGNYNYRNCEDILEAIKPLCVKYKALLVLHDEIETQGERVYVKATAILGDVENDGNVGITVTAFAREQNERKGMDASQVTGATSSYARKYALNGLFCIDDTKDADHNEPEGKKETTTQKKPAGKKKTYSNFDFLKEMKIIKIRLNKATGSDKAYYEALGGKGYEKSNQIPVAKQIPALKFFNTFTNKREKAENGNGNDK